MNGFNPSQYSGILITTPKDHGPIVTEPTVSCAHCGLTWVPRRGSGRKVGWCGRCMGIICGQQQCEKCVPVEQFLCNREHGMADDFTPVAASVPRSIRG